MYEVGVLASFLLWMWRAAMRLVMLNSRLQRNLRKVGMCLSLVTLLPRPMTDADRTRGKAMAAARYLALSAFGLATICLSWGSVALLVGSILYQRSKTAGAPAAVREFEWKMRNIDMDFDQIAREMYALHETMGLQQPAFDEFRQDLWQQVTAA